MTGTKYWMGSVPTKCDVTNKPITDEFIDGKTKMGPWGFLHPSALSSYGVGLGIGKGQRYKKQADGRWMKVEG